MEALRNKILVVDDEPVNLALMEAILFPLGYEVIQVTNGKEALEKVFLNKPDLVLLDIMMPDMDGYTVCKKIKNDMSTRFIPVIMITALNQLNEKIKGLEAGADDFLTKPVNELELTVRARSLLRAKKLNDQLIYAQDYISRLTSHIEALLNNFNPLLFEFESSMVNLIKQLFKDEEWRPKKVLVAFKEENAWNGKLYHAESSAIDDLVLDQVPFLHEQGKIHCFVSNSKDASSVGQYQLMFPPLLRQKVGIIYNFITYKNDPLLMLGFNYREKAGDYNLNIFQSLATYSHFLKISFDQVKETEKSFMYTIEALARAAEANDEDTGNHIVRVGTYAKVLAKSLNCSQSFIEAIKYSAQMHDVGKVHIHPDILRKPGRLSPIEWDILKRHTVYGTRIIGNSPRLRMARDIAMHHHEKWDGTGYPSALEGEKISLAGRIVAIADVYDALRSRRSYKPPFSHEKACRIITEGDDRVRPEHFDPVILGAFKQVSSRFEAVYEKLNDA